jgi:hypothetical protein
MAGHHDSPESSGPPYSDHQSPRIRPQSKEEVSANPSTPSREATTAEKVTRLGQGRQRHCQPTGKLPTRDSNSTTQKKTMRRERRRWRTHPSEEHGLKPTRKLPRRATNVPKLPKPLCSVSRG